MRISDLAIIVEILSISPMEMTEKLTPMSKTVLAKEQFNQAIFSKIFKKVVESLQIIGRIMRNRLCFRKARSNVFDVGVGISFNPQTVVTKEEIIALENQILERLINADVYTIFNLKFLALQKRWLAAVSNFVTFRVLQSVNEREIIDIRSLEIIEQVIIDFYLRRLSAKMFPIFFMY